jgi:hypothetical protein
MKLGTVEIAMIRLLVIRITSSLVRLNKSSRRQNKILHSGKVGVYRFPRAQAGMTQHTVAPTIHVKAQTKATDYHRRCPS